VNQNTKQRIVGTIVLLALALIFLPLIFDGQGSYQPQIASRIPDTPVVPLLNEPLPTRPVILGDEADATAVEPEESATDNAEPVPLQSKWLKRRRRMIRPRRIARKS